MSSIFDTIQHFFLVIVTGVLSVLTVAPFDKLPPTPTPTPTISITPLPIFIPSPTPIQYLTASGSYTDWNKSVNIELLLPINEGNISGNIVGVCTGEIRGKYASGEITGTAEGKCSNEILENFNRELIARATFQGTVDLSKNIIKIDFDGNLYPNPPYTDNTLHVPYRNKHVVLEIKR